MDYPHIYLDLETTGTSTQEDRIVEIAMIKYTAPGERTVKRTLVNPETPIPSSATECHGITDEMVKDAPKFRQMAKSLLEFIQGCHLIGYNLLHFDIPMLYAELTRAKVPWEHEAVLIVDACTIFKRKEERTLSAAVKFFLDEDHEGAHGAEADATATERVLAAELERYPELAAMTTAELALYSNHDQPRYDLGGFFTKDDQGRWKFAKGKHKDQLVADAPRHYLEWMTGPKASFLPDTLRIANGILWGPKNK